MVRNVHERVIPAPAADLAPLVDGLASADDRLWPADRWPRIRFDRGLAVGARGGHGPVRYEVAEYVPGERAVFRFTKDFDGTHRFEVWGAGGATLFRHVLEGRPRGWMRIGWPLALRPLHDACVEDVLDRAEAAACGVPYRLRPLSRRVRYLRRLGAALIRRGGGRARSPSPRARARGGSREPRRRSGRRRQEAPGTRRA